MCKYKAESLLWKTTYTPKDKIDEKLEGMWNKQGGRIKNINREIWC